MIFFFEMGKVMNVWFAACACLFYLFFFLLGYFLVQQLVFLSTLLRFEMVLNEVIRAFRFQRSSNLTHHCIKDTWGEIIQMTSKCNIYIIITMICYFFTAPYIICNRSTCMCTVSIFQINVCKFY